MIFLKKPTEKQKTLLFNVLHKKKTYYARQNKGYIRKALHQYQDDYWKALGATYTLYDMRRVANNEIDGSYISKGLKQFYYKAGLPYDKFLRSTAKACNPKLRFKAYTGETYFTPTDFDMFIADYIRTHTAARISWITGTTKSEFQRICNKWVDQGISEGWGVQKVADKIKKELNISEAFRAERIARTEMNALANEESMNMALDTGMQLDKIWLSSNDSRTRDAHTPEAIQVDRCDINDYFKVMGEDLFCPGDDNGSAENVINCRCDMYYEPK